MEKSPSMLGGLKSAIAGASLGLNVATAAITTATAASLLVAPTSVEAREGYKSRFDSEIEAKKYADKNGLVLVQAIGGFGFLTQAELEAVLGNPKLTLEQVMNYDGKSVRFIRIRGGQILPAYKIEIREDTSDKKEEVKPEDTVEDTPEDTPEDTENTNEDTIG